jgi:hypothetical protein
LGARLRLAGGGVRGSGFSRPTPRVEDEIKSA